MIECRTIKELCSVVVDCPHSTPTWTAEGKIVVRNNNIKNGRIDFSSPSYTDDEHYQQRIKRATPQGGDRIGGYCYDARDHGPGRAGYA